MLLRRSVYLLILPIFLILVSCTIPFTVNIEPRSQIEQPKDIQSIKIPYAVEIYFDENEVKSYRDYRFGDRDITYIFHTGKYLKDAINFYVYPHFDPNSNKNIILKIQTFDIKGYHPEERIFSLGKSAVDIILRTTIYYDNIILYNIYTEGASVVKAQLVDYSMWDAANNAIIEAVKKIPAQVAEVLSNPEVARIKLKEDIERRLKTIPIDSTTKSNYVSDYIALANISRLSKNYTEAIAAAKRALELSPDESDAYAVLGLLYKEQGHYKEAENYFKKAIELDSKQRHSYKLAELYLENENYKAAIEFLRKSLELKKDNFEVLLLLSIAYMNTGNYGEALDFSNRAIELATVTGIGVRIKLSDDKSYPEVVSIVSSGPADRAGIKVGDKITKIGGQSIKGWDINRVMQALKGDEGSKVSLTIEREGSSKAMDFSLTREKVIFNKSDTATAFAVKAFAFYGMNKVDEFYKNAEKAYQLDSNNQWARSSISAAYIEKGQYNETLQILSTIKDSPFDRVLETITYTKLGNTGKAVEVYKSIPENYFETKSAFRKIYITKLQNSMKPYKEHKLKVARDFEASKQYKDAIKEYNEYLKFADDKEAKVVRAHIAELIMRYPQYFTLTEEARKAVIRAETYTSEGKFEEAIKEYKKALTESPFFPALYKALALNFAQLKQYRQAIKYMNIYLDLYPDAPDVRAAKDEIYRWEFLMERGE
ncbi:hypothetical protein THC_0756 [Caldimicrobium thiodismutans]|uniref:PDZ domain-containing protein n=1 Tax=Caldimicrobium thiodismutans TaxID=1653476 RepID=A0A0U4W231_9BACT|nr:tetratricopeptide repeat protein [Caldimicrobium thiodismutans]BAU23147.1 hypothetical protein THC_0756 [Caldimicrobium thiodismutans]